MAWQHTKYFSHVYTEFKSASDWQVSVWPDHVNESQLLVLADLENNNASNI